MTGANVLFDAPGPRARRRSLIVSIIASILILAGVIWVLMTLAAPREGPGGLILPGQFDPARWDIYANPAIWAAIGGGVVRTLQAALVAAVLAILLGIVFSLLRSSHIAWIRIPTAVVLEFTRGMPVLLMMLFILLVASTGQYWAVVSALALYNGAIIGEALRAGLASLPRGQREAALSVGMRELQSKFLIEFPQAFRQMLPIIVAQLVVLLKDTALGFIVGYNELIRTTMYNLAAFVGNRYLFSLFFITLVIYLIINLTLSWFARWLSRRTASGGRKVKGKPVDPTQGLLVVQAAAAAQEDGGRRT